jgi:hypothetical protein
VKPLPVRNSAEVQRIAALPRWHWTKQQGEALAEKWSPQLLNAYGRELWAEAAKLDHDKREKRLAQLAKAGTPIRQNYAQALACYAFVQAKGLVAWMPPGKGKTLTTLQLTTLANQHWGVNNSALMVMASGAQQTHDDLGRLSEVWQMPAPPQVLTYSWMGTPGNGFKLCGCPVCAGAADEDLEEEHVDGAGLRPQLFIADECDMLRNDDSSVRRRVARYLSNHADYQISAFLTGTPVRKSYNNFRPMLLWALKEGAPMAFDWVTNNEICCALDTKPRDGVRNSPGALFQFAPEAEHLKDPARLTAVRKGFRKRITETPGVLAIDEASCDQPLTITLLQAPDDAALEAEFYRVKSEGTTLDGWEITDVFSEQRYLTELSVGGYSRWDPRPPELWAAAYKAKNRFVKDAITDSQTRGRRPLDSEKEVFQRFKDHPTLAEWSRIRPTFEPNSVFVQISLSVLQYAAKVIKQHSPCLVWVQHDWVGHRLSDITGLPYYAGKGKTAAGSYIGDADGTFSCILSANANRRQRNLQAFTHNIVIAPEASAERWEQQVSRSHRAGQLHPVHFFVILSAAASVKALEAALTEAEGAAEKTGLTQKLLTATWDWSQVTYAADPHSLPANDKRRSRWT